MGSMQKKRKRKKKTFTLIEIVIGIALLGLCAGIIGIKIFPLIEETKFEKQSQQIRVNLRVARELALTRQVDIQIIFQNSDKGLVLVTREDDRILLQKTFGAFSLEDHESLSIVCYGRGAILTPDIIHLVGRKKRLDLSLYTLFDYSQSYHEG